MTPALLSDYGITTTVISRGLVVDSELTTNLRLRRKSFIACFLVVYHWRELT